MSGFSQTGSLFETTGPVEHDGDRHRRRILGGAQDQKALAVAGDGVLVDIEAGARFGVWKSIVGTPNSGVGPGLTATDISFPSGLADVRGEIAELRQEMNRRFETTDAKVDRHFTWLVGIQVGALMAFAGALLRSYYR